MGKNLLCRSFYIKKVAVDNTISFILIIYAFLKYWNKNSSNEQCSCFSNPYVTIITAFVSITRKKIEGARSGEYGGGERTELNYSATLIPFSEFLCLTVSELFDPDAKIQSAHKTRLKLKKSKHHLDVGWRLSYFFSFS